jgi:hypothetical protein
MKSISMQPTLNTSHVPASQSAYPLPDLSYAEREALCSAGGCFHCRLSPSDTTWKLHIACKCPCDVKCGIPSCITHLSTQRNSGVTGSSNLVTALTVPSDVVMPSCVLEGDSDSDDSNDDYCCGY